MSINTDIWGSSDHLLSIDKHLEEYDANVEFWNDVRVCLVIACQCSDESEAINKLNSLHWGLVGTVAVDIAMKAYKDIEDEDPLRIPLPGVYLDTFVTLH